MCYEDLEIKDLYDFLFQESIENLEIWPECGIMEIPLSEKGSMDVEELLPEEDDEFTINFMNENKIKSSFYITFKESDSPAADRIIKLVCEKNIGFFCSDSEDFMPIIK